MGCSYQICCDRCKVVFKSSTRESDGTVKDTRNLAHAQGWVVNVPAWAARPGKFGPEPGRRERRIDFCRHCMDKKVADAMEAMYEKFDRELEEFDKNCKWAQARSARDSHFPTASATAG